MMDQLQVQKGTPFKSAVDLIYCDQRVIFGSDVINVETHCVQIEFRRMIPIYTCSRSFRLKNVQVNLKTNIYNYTIIFLMSS